MTSSLQERFWSKTFRQENGCLIWTGCCSSNGYGTLFKARKYKQATHVAWFLAKGVWPDPKKKLCHTCDTPSCVEILHLFEGTNTDNMQDASRKGRLVRTVTPEMRFAIKAEIGSVPYRVLRAKYGVSLSEISRIKRRDLNV